MRYFLAVFTSRHATLSFANLLRAHGVPVAIVNTPSSVSRVCGISVKFPEEFQKYAKKLIGGSLNFVGFFLYDPANGITKKM